MKNSLLAFFAGIGAAVLVGVTMHSTRRGRRWMESYRDMAQLDLNSASRPALLALGLNKELVDRVIENRPYRNKMDLVSRMVLPQSVYAGLRHRIKVAETSETTKVA